MCLCTCVYVCGVEGYFGTWWWSQNNLRKAALSFHHVGPEAGSHHSVGVFACQPLAGPCPLCSELNFSHYGENALAHLGFG